MLMFSSDYPHVEGGRDPIGKFTAALVDAPEGVNDLFFSGNFAEMMGPVMDRVPAPAGA
jgi:hypothetical protein